jgi:hypothetical protein
VVSVERERLIWAAPTIPDSRPQSPRAHRKGCRCFWNTRFSIGGLRRARVDHVPRGNAIATTEGTRGVDRSTSAASLRIERGIGEATHDGFGCSCGNIHRCSDRKSLSLRAHETVGWIRIHQCAGGPTEGQHGRLDREDVQKPLVSRLRRQAARPDRRRRRPASEGTAREPTSEDRQQRPRHLGPCAQDRGEVEGLSTPGSS